MKRLFAIVILNIFLLNVLGYYGILLQIKENAGEELSEKLDSGMYDSGSTVTFQIPFEFPYGSHSKSYQRVDGQFEKDGVVYRMVEQRAYKEHLYIVCVKDHKSSEINSAINDVAQGFAGHDDHQAASQGLIKDYVNLEISVAPAMDGWQMEVNKTTFIHNLSDSFFASIVHPPC